VFTATPRGVEEEDMRAVVPKDVRVVSGTVCIATRNAALGDGSATVQRGEGDWGREYFAINKYDEYTHRQQY